MTTVQEVVDRNTIVQEVVRPFAKLMSGPNSVLPAQEHFDALAELYSAGPHPDFQLPSDYKPWESSNDIGYYANLPFRLALGIHKAVRRGADKADTIATFDEYSQIQPLHLVQGGRAVEIEVMKGRAQAVLIGAILTAATQRNLEAGRPEQAIGLVQNALLLSKRQIRLLKRAVNSVSFST